MSYAVKQRVRVSVSSSSESRGGESGGGAAPARTPAGRRFLPAGRAASPFSDAAAENYEWQGERQRTADVVSTAFADHASPALTTPSQLAPPPPRYPRQPPPPGRR